jgi:hypothetical protein
VRHENVATFLLKKTPFTSGEIAQLRAVSKRLEFDVLYAPGDGDGESTADGAPQVSRPVGDVIVDGASTGDYARLIVAADRERFYQSYRSDIRPTTDDRPFFFHTTKIEDQFDVAFGQKMLFGNGLSALMTLLGISTALVVLFVLAPLALAGRGQPRTPGWFAWLVYFGALGAGFMLIEVSVLQRFVLLLGHPVYSLTVTLFSLLLGTGLGSAWSRRFDEASLRRRGAVGILIVAAIAILFIAGGDAGRELGDPLFEGGADDGRRGDARADRHRARDSDADRHASVDRAGASDAGVGLGDERRPVGPRRHAGHLHCDELGLPNDAADCVRCLPHRPHRSPVSRHNTNTRNSLWVIEPANTAFTSNNVNS